MQIGAWVLVPLHGAAAVAWVPVPVLLQGAAAKCVAVCAEGPGPKTWLAAYSKAGQKA